MSKFLENFVYLILLNGFWFVHIPLGGMVKFIIIIIIIIIILLLREFFSPVLPDGFTLEFEWQQISSSLQDSS